MNVTKDIRGRMSKEQIIVLATEVTTDTPNLANRGKLGLGTRNERIRIWGEI